jgi:hypothetical protein
MPWQSSSRRSGPSTVSMAVRTLPMSLRRSSARRSFEANTTGTSEAVDGAEGLRSFTESAIRCKASSIEAIAKLPGATPFSTSSTRSETTE